MRKYTNLQEIILTSNVVCNNQRYFMDNETKQTLRLRDDGQVWLQRFLYSGKELESVYRSISEDLINEIFYALKKYTDGGAHPSIRDVGSWHMKMQDQDQKRLTVNGSILFGSNTRELHLSDFMRDRLGIRYLYLFDGVPFHRIAPDRTRQVYEFSKKWLEIINNSPNWFYLMKVRMLDEMAELHFEMDYGKTFESAYQINGDWGDLALFRSLIPQIHNIEILGAAICSQVYYYLCHAEQERVHFEEAEDWLRAAFGRLYQLNRDVEY